MSLASKLHSRGVKIALVALLAAIFAATVAFIFIVFLENTVPTMSEPSDGYTSSVPVASASSEAVPSEPQDNGIRLQVTSPEKQSFTTTSNTFSLSGSSDPDEPLTLNGRELERDENGFFAADLSLKLGKNTFTLSHKGDTKTYTVTYRYVVISSYSPKGNQIYSCGSTFGVSVTARSGSKVTARFNGKTIALAEDGGQTEGDFKTYSGQFTLPSDNIRDINLGSIKFSATQNGVTEAFFSGDITCKKPNIIVDYDPNATPAGGKYINVGSGLIAEIVHFSAETFDAYSTDDKSSPLNNYLPAGTVDYVAQGRVYYTSGSKKKEYAVLRYGKQVYTEFTETPNKKTVTVIKEYTGTLPDHNEISVAAVEEGQRFTTLTFDCLWKAPFYFELLPQKYTSPKNQDYTVSSVTASYVDITFCYATVFEGEITLSAENPLFKSAKLIKNQSDYTLRLYLKKQGGFYGWDSYYNSKGQLCFEFLQPATVTAADNKYGVDLTGVKIMVDAGHNGTGVDIGAPGLKPGTYHEAERNLKLARKIRDELLKTGADVVMTRNSAVSNITYQQRIKLLKTEKPDYCVAVHHDSSTSSSAKGFGAFYSTLFSKNAAEYIHMRTYNAGIYKEVDKLSWHYFFLARTTNCPVVLTENGYMSNREDFNTIIDESTNIKKAEAIVQGIADYFLSIQ